MFSLMVSSVVAKFSDVAGVHLTQVQREVLEDALHSYSSCIFWEQILHLAYCLERLDILSKKTWQRLDSG